MSLLNFVAGDDGGMVVVVVFGALTLDTLCVCVWGGGGGGGEGAWGSKKTKYACKINSIVSCIEINGECWFYMCINTCTFSPGPIYLAATAHKCSSSVVCIISGRM